MEVRGRGGEGGGCSGGERREQCVKGGEGRGRGESTCAYIQGKREMEGCTFVFCCNL